MDHTLYDLPKYGFLIFNEQHPEFSEEELRWCESHASNGFTRHNFRGPLCWDKVLHKATRMPSDVVMESGQSHRDTPKFIFYAAGTYIGIDAVVFNHANDAMMYKLRWS